MPIYDYACTRCGRVVEVVHGVHGRGPETCETCGGPMKKLLSTPAVHFKGSGWAKKDRGASTTTKAAARSASAGSHDDEKAGSSGTATEGTKTGAGESAGTVATSKRDPD